MQEIVILLTDATLEPAQQCEFVSILESSDDAKRYYLNYLQLHADVGNDWCGEQLPLRIEPDFIAEPPHVSRACDGSDSRATLRALGWLILGMMASSRFFVVMQRFRVRQWWAPQTVAVAVHLLGFDPHGLSVPFQGLDQRPIGVLPSRIIHEILA
jgi:hypothetical protein